MNKVPCVRTTVRKLPEADVVRIRGFVELGAWQRNNLRQSPKILFFPWTTVSELPEAPKLRPKPSESEAINKPQGIETARRYQALLDNGTVKTRAELARFLGVSRARVTQVLKRIECDSGESPGGQQRTA